MISFRRAKMHSCHSDYYGKYLDFVKPGGAVVSFSEVSVEEEEEEETKDEGTANLPVYMYFRKSSPWLCAASLAFSFPTDAACLIPALSTNVFARQMASATSSALGNRTTSSGTRLLATSTAHAFRSAYGIPEDPMWACMV